MTSFPAGVFGTRSKPLGGLELLLHAWAWHFFVVLVPRCWQLLRACLLGTTSRRRWLLPVLASWRHDRRVCCGPPNPGITRRALLWRGRGIKLSYARPCVGPPCHPWPHSVTCSLSSWGKHPPTWLSTLCPSVACCLSLLDPSCPAVQAWSRSSVSTCSRGRGSLVGIVVACTRWRMSRIRAVRVGRPHAGTPNYRPTAPLLSAQCPKCLAVRQGSCVTYQLRWNSNVKLSFMPL